MRTHHVLFFLAETSIPEIVEYPPSHELLDPNTQVHMETTPTLSFHRNKKILAQIQKDQPSLAERKRCPTSLHASQHDPPTPCTKYKRIMRSEFTAWALSLLQHGNAYPLSARVQIRPLRKLCACDVRSGKNQGCTKQLSITKTYMTKHGPVSIRPDYLIHTQVESPQGSFHTPGHGFVLPNFRHETPISTQFQFNQKFLRSHLTQLLECLFPRLLVSK